MMRTLCLLALTLAALLPLQDASAQVVISEFMASNTHTLADEDGEYSDWIELHNTGASLVNLDNWFLTDNAALLTQWRLPGTNLPPDGYLLVFASGKDRHRAGAPLHTNFKLSTTGEYLGLIQPDGKTIAFDYAPTFPPQVDDVSCGLDPGLRPLTLLSTNAPGRLWVATDDSLGLGWTLPGFDDSGWRTATSAVGYAIAALDRVPLAGLLDGIAGYWKFNETAGFPFADASGHSADAAILGMPVSFNPWTNGVDGGALRFRGTTYRSVARVPDYPKATPTSGLSASAWVLADVRTTWATIAKNWSSTGGQFHFGLRDTAGDLDLSINTSAGQFNVREGVPLTTGQWHHVAFTADGTTLRLFRDGLLVASSPYGGGFTNPPIPYLGIGGRLNDAGAAADTGAPGIWNGRIDEVALWNRSLSDAEVTAIHEAGLAFGIPIRTDLRADLAGRPGSLYLRFPFLVDDPATLVNQRISLRYDDGVSLWLNGEPIVQRNVPDPLGATSLALEARPPAEARDPELMSLADYSNLFVAGTNWLAIQVVNVSPDDNDLLVEPLLEGASTTSTTNQIAYFTQPTPGAANRFGVRALGPIISQPEHIPALPRDDDDLLVTARVVPTFSPIGGVFLKYRVMYTNEVVIPMLDDGAHGDGAAGDGIFGASIPAAASSPGQMIRYAILAVDTLSRTNRLPLFPDRLNSAEYFGTAVFNPAVTSSIPVLQWFIKTPSGAEADPGTQASILYSGEFYDNVYVRIRGGTSRSWPKHSYKVELTPDHEFLIHPGVGRVTEFDLNTTYTDKSYVRAVLTSGLQLDSGMPSPETFHTRIEQNGKFYSVALWTEQPDKAFLRRHGLDDHGALYKAGPGAFYDVGTDPSFEKKTRLTEDKSDLLALLKAIQQKGTALENFVFDNIDIPGQLEYMATTAVTQNIDASDKNHFLYRDTEGTGEWVMLPWDLDLTFGPDALNTDNMVYAEEGTSHPFIGARPYLLSTGKYNVFLETIVNTPRTRQMLLCRIRSLVDQYLAAGYFQGRIDALAAAIGPDVKLDQAKWKADGYFSGNFYTLPQALDRIKNEYLTPRVGYLRSLNLPGIGAANPGFQPYAPPIHFGERLVTPPTGNQDEEYVQLVNTNDYPVDLSGWRITGDISMTLRAGTVLPTNGVLYLSPKVPVFRARASAPTRGQGLFVQGNYQGHMNARGGTVRLLNTFGREIDTLTYDPHPSLTQQYLQVTELMYHPPVLPGDAYPVEEYEYLELRNASPSTTLPLTGVRFVRGLLFDFTSSAIPTLAPGARVVVARNLAAFRSRYGSAPAVAGEYLGSLNNGRDGIRLEDALGEVIADFSYSNQWEPITDGLGFSLVLGNEPDLAADPGSRESWRVGSRFLGTPGDPEPPAPSIPPVQVTEALTASLVAGGPDVIELHNPTPLPAILDGWYLSDDLKTPKKFRIPAGSIVAAGGYLLFTSKAFGAGTTGFQLGSDGDEVWLFSGDAAGNLTGYHHGFRFGALPAGMTFGRHVDSLSREHFVPQTEPTLGARNAGPKVGPVVISEIAYHPMAAPGSEGDFEFIELQNIGTQPESLSVPGALNPAWELAGGVRFSFPPDLVLPPGGSVLVVGFDPIASPAMLAAFRAAYGIDPSAKVVGPWLGGLANSGDRIRLQRPVETAGTVPLSWTTDEVGYGDSAPWPGGDGDGTSLHRTPIDAFGDDPASWVAAVPSPGVPYGPGVAPHLTQEPADLSVVAFQSGALQSAATGPGPIRFQWTYNGQAIAGATNASLQFTGISPQQFGRYRVTAFNRFGSAMSSNATVNVLLPPFILQPPLGRWVRVGSNVTFSVTAAGTGPLSYQWRKNGIPLAGAQASTLTITSAQPGDSGLYDVVVSDGVGPMVSDAAPFTVFTLPVITVQPDDITLLVGQTLRLTGGGEGTEPLSFKWRRNGAVLAPQTNAVLLITNAQVTHSGTYSMLAINFAGTATSRGAVVTVLADADKDGMADAWESTHGLDPTNPADALLDPDGDGVINRDEYLAGTDPHDPASFLHFTSVLSVATDAGVAAAFSFNAMSNHTYAILGREGMGVGGWTSRWSFASQPTNWTAWVTNLPTPGRVEFYRIQTPR